MNRAFLTTAILFGLSIRTAALSRTEADSLAAIGQRAYAAGEYAGALAAFDSVSATYRSAALCLALGNTARPRSASHWATRTTNLAMSRARSSGTSAGSGWPPMTMTSK